MSAVVAQSASNHGHEYRNVFQGTGPPSYRDGTPRRKNLPSSSDVATTGERRTRADYITDLGQVPPVAIGRNETVDLIQNVWGLVRGKAPFTTSTMIPPTDGNPVTLLVARALLEMQDSTIASGRPFHPVRHHKAPLPSNGTREYTAPTSLSNDIGKEGRLNECNGIDQPV